MSMLPWRSRSGVTVISVLIAGTVLISLASPVFAAVQQQDITLPSLSDVVCQSYMVYDRTKSEVLISQNPDNKIYPASMTKIMTAALALDNLSTDQMLTVSKSAIDATTPNSTLMGLEVGEEISVSELLYGLLLPSGNDAANVLAEAIVTAKNYSDSSNPTRTKLDLFADIMNQKVSELGLTNTHFANANGLHDDNHYTTASDLAKIFNYALSHDDFRTVISSPTHVFKATNKHTFDAWSFVKNTDCLLADPWILGADTSVAEVVGGKTGTTIPAGTGMVLLTVDKNGDELINVVCGIPYENANRLSSYMAAIVNAGALACFQKDSVIRASGNVMDNKPFNASADVRPSGISAAPTAVPTSAQEITAAPQAGGTTAPAVSPATTVKNNNSTSSDSSPAAIIKAHPVISILLVIVLIVFIFLLVVYFSAKRKRKRRNSGIRRM
jgi:D-alanyl-D-alanine carboxypeptidase